IEIFNWTNRIPSLTILCHKFWFSNSNSLTLVKVKLLEANCSTSFSN
ncbi:14643_t:CDS:1, partial [Acaulospora colombiana]